jgi:hypothetical protein
MFESLKETQLALKKNKVECSSMANFLGEESGGP